MNSQMLDKFSKDEDRDSYLSGALDETTDEISPREVYRPKGTVVVKVGGSTFGNHDTTIKNLVDIQKQGVPQIVVHGGGKVITEWMVRQGVRPKFVRGLRVTDKASLEIVIAVLAGIINKSITASINQLGGKAVGLSGVDGGMLRADILDPELGFVGEIKSVDVGPINALVKAGFIPVIAPLALSVLSGHADSHIVLNVNADTVAGEIASTINADRLVMLTDVEGVMDSSRRLIPKITRRQALALISSNIVDGGMTPKIAACLKALDHVSSTHIVDGRKADVLHDVLAGKLLGTVLD